MREFEESIFERVNAVFEQRERVGAELARRIEVMKDRRNDPAFNVREYVEGRRGACGEFEESVVRGHSLFGEYEEWFRKLVKRERKVEGRRLKAED